MLVTLPDHDITTYYLSEFGRKATETAKQNGIKVIELKRDKANRKNLESYINSIKIDFIMFNGHGNKTTIAGYNNEPLVIANDNEDLLNSIAVYSISCASASELGEYSIKAGAKCFVGYNDDFIFLYDSNRITKPTGDALAQMFLDHSTLFVQSFSKGNTIKEAYEKARENLLDNFQKAITTDQKDIATYLWWDYQNFVAKGDINIKI